MSPAGEISVYNQDYNLHTNLKILWDNVKVHTGQHGGSAVSTIASKKEGFEYVC